MERKYLNVFCVLRLRTFLSNIGETTLTTAGSVPGVFHAVPVYAPGVWSSGSFTLKVPAFGAVVVAAPHFDYLGSSPLGFGLPEDPSRSLRAHCWVVPVGEGGDWAFLE